MGKGLVTGFLLFRVDFGVCLVASNTLARSRVPLCVRSFIRYFVCAFVRSCFIHLFLRSSVSFVFCVCE